MAIKILVVEDSESTGSMLSKHLTDHLVSIANEAGFPPAHGGKPGDWSGHLRQLRPFLWQYQYSDFEVRLLPFSMLKDLVSAASKKKRLEEEMHKASADLFSSSLGKLPDVMLVDLALSREETQRLVSQGGNDEPSPTNGTQLRDPRDTLEELAGFQILRAFGETIPVITTSYARNPLVRQHCMMNGAYGAIRKPIVGHHSEIEGENHKGWDMATAAKMHSSNLEVAALQNRDPLAVVVGYYINVAAAEVLRAVQSHVLRLADNHLPDGFSRGLLTPPPSDTTL